MRYANLLFDLDGTLTDPGLGIKNSIRYALNKRDLPSLTEKELDCFIGPPLLDSFEKYCCVSREEAMELLAAYREYFSTKGLFENQVYGEISKTLERLREMGFRLFVATSKPEPFAKQILEHFDLAKYFSFIGGSTMDETRTEKADVIAYVLEQTGIEPAESVMVGDRIYDIQGGQACGLFTVGVLYGYGSCEELSHADWLVKSPWELTKLLE